MNIPLCSIFAPACHMYLDRDKIEKNADENKIDSADDYFASSKLNKGENNEKTSDKVQNKSIDEAEDGVVASVDDYFSNISIKNLEQAKKKEEKPPTAEYDDYDTDSSETSDEERISYVIDEAESAAQTQDLFAVDPLNKKEDEGERAKREFKENINEMNREPQQPQISLEQRERILQLKALKASFAGRGASEEKKDIEVVDSDDHTEWQSADRTDDYSRGSSRKQEDYSTSHTTDTHLIMNDVESRKKDELNADSPKMDQQYTKQSKSTGYGDSSSRQISNPAIAYMIDHNILTQNQMDIAYKRRAESVGTQNIFNILLEMEFITSEDLINALDKASNIKYIDVTKAGIDSSVVKKIPQNIAMENKLILFEVDEEKKEIHVATDDVYNVIAFDKVKNLFPSWKLVKFYTKAGDIENIIYQYYNYEMSLTGILKEIEDKESTNDANVTSSDNYVNPIVRLVDAIIFDAVQKGASDIHIEPEESFVRLRYRIDGYLQEQLTFHKDHFSSVVVRIKIMSSLNIAETRMPQDGRINYNTMGRAIDLRISTQPTIHGENIVGRILDRKSSIMELDDMGFSDNNIVLIKKLLKRPEGVVIVTGPTGSGKSTTLYSILNYINDISVNIMTLEDPVEYQIPMIRQSHIKASAGMTFSSGIKTLMRQDPDIIFVGEVRDEDTASMTLRAAMTGHQVFTTLHTNNAIGALPRLIDMGISRTLLSGNIICIVAQRLARRLCKSCKIEYAPADYEIEFLDRKEFTGKLHRHNPKGCSKCSGIGYKGRIAIHEILPIDKKIDIKILDDSPLADILSQAEMAGFVSLADDGIEKVLNGLTDIQELVDTIDMTERMKDASLFI